MAQKFLKVLYPLLLLVLFTILTETVLAIVFAIKDRNAVVEPVHDYPYLYFAFDDRYETNEHGFKTNKPMAKSPGTYRIILTGGSVARSGIRDNMISRFMELKLKQRLGVDSIEVINAGVSAYVVEQEFILTQLLLQHYNPDMIVALDGYNDALTLMLNPDWEETFALKPHNWADFKVIAENRRQNSYNSRFRYTFRNITRALDYLTKPTDETPRAVNPQDHLADYQNVTNTYYQVVQDIHDFCAAKNITYVHFVQPVNQTKLKERFKPHQANVVLTTLQQMYAASDSIPYVYSLQHLLDDNQDYYVDDVHVRRDGNLVFATAIVNVVEPVVKQALNGAEMHQVEQNGQQQQQTVQ